MVELVRAGRYPEELSREFEPSAQAIRANTYGAAYGTGVEDKIGSLEAGKLADLIVLDQNLFEIDPHDIHKVKVLYTVMGGRLVYEADGDGQ